MTSETKQRNDGLDLLRSIAIVLVLICHLCYSLKSIEGAGRFAFYPGFYGVEFFFVLSGFLIGDIALRSGLSGYRFLKDFWCRRWIRTLPNYFMFLFLYIYISDIDLSYCRRYFFFMQNLTMPHPRLFSQAWSLAIEEWFYVLLPLLLLVSRFFIKRKVLADSISILGFIFLITVFRAYTVLKNDLDWNSELRTVVVYRLDAIMYGVFVSWLKLYFPIYFKKFPRIKFALGLTGLVVSVVAIDPFFQKSFLSQALSFSLVSFSTALLFPALLKIHLKEGFVKSLVYRLSVYSYTIYLCHFQWQFIYHKFFTQQFDFKGYVLDFWFSLTYLMTVVIFSFLWYHFVESKITNLRRYLR